MPLTSDSGRPCRCARSSSTKVSSPSPSTTTSNGLVPARARAPRCRARRPAPSGPRETSPGSSGPPRVSGHSVLNMQLIPMTRLSGWIRAAISSNVSPWIMKSARSGRARRRPAPRRSRRSRGSRSPRLDRRRHVREPQRRIRRVHLQARKRLDSRRVNQRDHDRRYKPAYRTLSSDQSRNPRGHHATDPAGQVRSAGAGKPVQQRDLPLHQRAQVVAGDDLGARGGPAPGRGRARGAPARGNGPAPWLVRIEQEAGAAVGDERAVARAVGGDARDPRRPSPPAAPSDGLP